jgi:hypothetical protein
MPVGKGKREKISRNTGKHTLDESKAYSLGQVNLLPTRQPFFLFLNYSIPNGFRFKGSTKRMTQVTQRKRRDIKT